MKKNNYGLFIFSGIIVIEAFILIWWGAAVTTEDVGLVVPDWPLSFGQINPTGWWSNIGIRLEHGHRLLAILLGSLISIFFVIIFLKNKSGNVFEVITIFVPMAIMVDFARKAGIAETTSAFYIYFISMLVLDLVCIIWWVRGIKYRNWNSITILVSLALLGVVNQAIMGGLRVTQYSNIWAVFHGCFAQAFFCLLILIAYLLKPRQAKNISLKDNDFSKTKIYKLALGLFLTVFLQLIFGAIMRHTHRIGLPVNDFPLMNGSFIPKDWNFDIAIHFIHRMWAYFLFLLSLGIFIFNVKNIKKYSSLLKYTLGILGMIFAQIMIAVFVILTNKSFWPTNLHVINGLLILTLSFLLLLRILHYKIIYNKK